MSLFQCTISQCDITCVNDLGSRLSVLGSYLGSCFSFLKNQLSVLSVSGSKPGIPGMGLYMLTVMALIIFS